MFPLVRESSRKTNKKERPKSEGGKSESPLYLSQGREAPTTALQKSITFTENHKTGRSRRFVSRETLVLSTLSTKKERRHKSRGAAAPVCGSEKCK